MYITIDIGATNTDISLFKSLSADSLENSVTFKTPNKYADAIEEIKKSISRLADKSHILKILISFPGIVKDGKEIIQASNITDYNKKPLAQDLEIAFGTEVIMIQDCSAASLAEIKFGDIGNSAKIVNVILGTGIGTALIENFPVKIRPVLVARKVVTPLESGGMIISNNKGRKHSTVNMKGILEAYVGGGSLNDFYNFDLSKLKSDDKFWGEFTDYLAVGLHNLNCLLKPDKIIIGGKIGQQRKTELQNVIEKLDKYSDIIGKPEIQFTKLRGEAKTIGALSLLSLNNVIVNI